MLVTIAIPDDLRFAELRLSRDLETGDIGFHWGTIERICIASGLDPAALRSAPEDNIASLIVAWYRAARDGGEPADPVAELLIAEVAAEDEFGGARIQRGSQRTQ